MNFPILSLSYIIISNFYFILIFCKFFTIEVRTILEQEDANLNHKYVFYHIFLLFFHVFFLLFTHNFIFYFHYFLFFLNLIFILFTIYIDDDTLCILHFFSLYLSISYFFHSFYVFFKTYDYFMST